MKEREREREREINLYNDDITLKEYIERRFTDLDKIYETKIIATEKALTLSQESLNKRLEGI